MYGLKGVGVSGGAGIYALSSATNVTVAKLDGYVSMGGGTNPAASTGFADSLTRANLIKAWAYIDSNSGTPLILDGFNVASASVSTSFLTVTFGTAMASTTYGCLVFPDGLGGTQPLVGLVSTRNAGSIIVRASNNNTVTFNNFATGSIRLTIMVLGAM
jgi:hypothetical protein